ncbi:NAD(P)-dependent oxidoreductase [Myroides sp. C15-4]|uniref:NAD(P)-dependent oxidoreductase n=1 Tax=Myroides sp. C15-4 TaxID=3400532 RepID=UPI003D2F98F1
MSDSTLLVLVLNTLLNEEDLDWVFFSPAGSLEPGERTGVYRLGKDDLIRNEAGESKISVGDYAKAMIDELEHPKHHQERFTIGY